MARVAEIVFRPVTKADLITIEHWMSEPHWREWWGETQTELGYIIDMLEGRDTTRPFIFEMDGQAMGYIQVWAVKDQRVEPWITLAPWLREFSDETVGVDLSIGAAANLSSGIGTIVLRAFVDKLRCEGHHAIIIDPEPRNARAIRAYEKAGFRIIEALNGKYDDVLLMRHES